MAWNAKALGLAGGTLWGAIMLVGTTAAVLFDYGNGFFNVWMALYPGYAITWLGVVLGAVYGFIDGFIGGWVVAWLYNKFGG
ncbi:hypothetical protein GOV07_05580 [Candidatus Woesearchaeota archaeon]|nr:hypothetical protein [Candidatus Woesearchaeota archaeon]